MKKSLLAMTALAAMLFAGCTSSDELTTLESIKQAENAPTPVSFGTYMGKTSTRAGITGDMTTDVLKTTGHDYDGFGVFAYHTAGTGTDLSYNSSTSLPNFMYNERVYWDGSSTSWTYSPIKYWPNEAAANSGVDTKTSNGATTTSGVDKVSFFAYAPYVALSATALSGTGITAINGRATSGGTDSPTPNGNQKPGDPTISYTVGTIGEGVDLCWGVVPASTTYVTVLTTDQNPTEGLPNLNLIKQEVNEKVEFLFKHALTKVRFTIQAAVNQTGAGGTLDAATKIFVNSVAITGSASFPASGDLNLNNTAANTPKWENTTGTAALTNGTLNTNIKSGGAGVLTSDATAVFSNTNDWYYLIPGTSGSLTINCNYNVETTDEKLNGGKSTIVNDISKTLTSLTLEPGKAYTINIVLGLTSVDFNATVADWVGETAVVNLPLNY